MRSDPVFRLATYLTLALAALCLASANEAFLPGMMRWLIPVEVLIGLAFVLEGRWSLTPFWSNLLGLLIAVGSAVWIAWNITSPSNQWFRYAPYPVALLPYAAPLVLVLMLAKLFRSHSGPDFWMLQALGLMQVALACILANDPAFGVWLFAYVVCGLWSLALRARGRLPDHRPGRLGGLGFVLPRVFLITIFGAVLFLVSPRFAAEPWSLLGAPAQVGYSPQIDLNYTGPVRTSDQVVFQVYAEDAHGRPVPDLDPAQHWRGTTLDTYARGCWTTRHLDLLSPGPASLVPIVQGDQADLPDLGPDQRYLSFSVDLPRANGLFLAAPVTFLPDQGQPPVRSGGRWLSWVPLFHEPDGTLFLPQGRAPNRYRYQQVVLPLDDRVPRPAAKPPPDTYQHLLRQPVPRIRTWTLEVLHHLASVGRLTPEDLTMAADPELGPGTLVLPRNREKVARALTAYLADSGAFTYKLEMRRHDFSVDALEDFLCNVKQGYCEHFAAGLVLMLRSVGIPARVVNGYRGAESQADVPGREGWYVVRQNQAHSWVEALVPRSDADGGAAFAWLMLDPTPGGEVPAEGAATWGQWWRTGLDQCGEVWRELVLGYTRDKQTAAATHFWGRLALEQPFRAVAGWFDRGTRIGFRWALVWPWLLVPAALGLAYALLRWTWRRRGRRPSRLPVTAVAFYNHFLALVAHHCRLQPLPSQTPREFGEVVGQALRATPATAGLASVPGEVIRLYYRVRFGGRTLSPAVDQEIARRLHELEGALRGRREAPGRVSPRSPEA